MPGQVLRILVEPGQVVEKGTPLLVLVAMKMENMIKAQGPATVTKILVAENDNVEKGHVLIAF
jgi:biotin carboxyl carrier protein